MEIDERTYQWSQTERIQISVTCDKSSKFRSILLKCMPLKFLRYSFTSKNDLKFLFFSFVYTIDVEWFSCTSNGNVALVNWNKNKNINSTIWTADEITVYNYDARNLFFVMCEWRSTRNLSSFGTITSEWITEYITRTRTREKKHRIQNQNGNKTPKREQKIFGMTLYL